MAAVRLTVEEALARILDGAAAADAATSVSTLMRGGGPCAGRTACARALTQPPFDASAMDGYAVRAADVATLPATLTVIGEAAAGHGFAARVGAGQAVRIFTGAPIPDGADAIVIQENTTRDGDRVTVREGAPDAEHVRAAAAAISRMGDVLIGSGRRLTARDVTLAAAMGHATLGVRRRRRSRSWRPATNWCRPERSPAPDQIVCSNTYGVAAMVAAAGGDAAASRHRRAIRAQSLEAKLARGGRLPTSWSPSAAPPSAITISSDRCCKSRGMALDFWKIAMRPGKPLMFGRLGAQRVLGLPGNPVSSLSARGSSWCHWCAPCSASSPNPPRA